mgnify:CR=1 FL=1
MAKYSDIKGFTVQTLSTDTIASAAAGGTWASSPSANVRNNRASEMFGSAKRTREANRLRFIEWLCGVPAPEHSQQPTPLILSY